MRDPIHQAIGFGEAERPTGIGERHERLIGNVTCLMLENSGKHPLMGFEARLIGRVNDHPASRIVRAGHHSRRRDRDMLASCWLISQFLI
jgi:hypothetical protein